MFREASCPTCWRHLGDVCAVGSVGKPWLVVVDVLHLDDELGLRLQREACVHVNRLGLQCVVRLYLPVKYHIFHKCTNVDVQ